MRKNIFFFTMALLAGLVLSCRDDVEVPAFVGTEEIFVLPPELETKAPLSTFPTSRGFVMGTSYKAATSSTGSLYFSGITFSYNSTAQGWKASTAKYWPIDGYLDILAYSTTLGVSGVSWSSDGSSSVSMSVPDNGTAQDDIMCAGAVNKTKGALTLAFTHAQAQVAFKAYADEAYNSSTNVGVTINSITLASAKYSGTLTATRNTGGAVSYSWSNLGSASTKAVDGASFNISATAAASANSIGTGILLPTQASVGFTVNYTLHNGKDASGNPVDKTLSYSYSPSSSTWSAGNKYEYTIHITEGQVSVAASLSAWTGATQTWLYATGNATSHQGANFALASGQPVYWRESGSDSYEALTYSSGTYGSSVVYESANYLVTITAAGSLFEVSYESKRAIESICLVVQPATGVVVNAADSSLATVNFSTAKKYSATYLRQYGNSWTTGGYSAGCEINALVKATYSDGTVEYLSDMVIGENMSQSVSYIGRGGFSFNDSWKGTSVGNENSLTIEDGKTIKIQIMKAHPETWDGSKVSNQKHTSGSLTYSYNGTAYPCSFDITCTANVRIISTSEICYYESDRGSTKVPVVKGLTDLTFDPNSIKNGYMYKAGRNLTEYISDVSVASGQSNVSKASTNSFLIASNADVSSGAIQYTAYLTNTDGSSLNGCSNIWGAEATKSIELRFQYFSYSDGGYSYGDYSNYICMGDYPKNAAINGSGTFSSPGLYYSRHGLCLFKIKGDNSLENITYQATLSLSERCFHWYNKAWDGGTIGRFCCFSNFSYSQSDLSGLAMYQFSISMSDVYYGTYLGSYDGDGPFYFSEPLVTATYQGNTYGIGFAVGVNPPGM